MKRERGRDFLATDTKFCAEVQIFAFLIDKKSFCSGIMTTKATKITGSKKNGKELAPLKDELETGMSESGEEFEGFGDPEEDEEAEGEEEEKEEEEEDSAEDEDEDEEEGVPLSDIDLDAAGDDIDVVPYQKVFKDNHAALTQALSTFALSWSSLPFHSHQSITASEDVTIDINDDLSRELAFYKQALEAVQEARTRIQAEGIPFSRPSDYFAEMIKDDEHMEKACFLFCRGQES